MNPVWKDLDVNLNASTPIEYSVEFYNEDSVFSGVAVPKPGTNYAKIRINDFAKNMVNSNIEGEDMFFTGNDYFNIPNYCKEIVISTPTANGSKTILYADYFYNSYNYNDSDNLSTDGVYLLSENRIGKVTNNGYTLFSFFNSYETEISASVRTQEHYNTGGGSFILNNVSIPPMSAVVFFINDKQVGSYILFDFFVGGELYTTVDYKVVESCNRYNLHYQNAMGGYDTISVEGRKDKRTDNLTFDYYKARGNNQDLTNPQMNKYKVDITPKWELQTGWINDTDSEKMYNIFTSQKMWLEDTETGTVYPVYITNSSVDYKTFTNQGRKKYNYTFSITSSNTLVKL